MELTLLAFLSLIFAVSPGMTQHTITAVACPNTYFSPTCNESTVLLMQTALYGRMAAGLCFGVDDNLGCSADVLPALDTACSGRYRCNYDVDALRIYVDPTLWPNSCSAGAVSYLEVTYQCLPVHISDIESCEVQNETRLPGSSGFVASVTLEQGLYGTQSCPWTVRVQAGQRVRIVLYDFSSRTSGTSGEGCGVNIIITDGDFIVVRNICNGASRERYLYTSTNSFIKFYVELESGELGYFLLQYQDIGCPLFPAPDNSHVSFSLDTAFITCNSTGQQWQLICIGNDWSGHRENCTQAPDDEGDEGGGSDFPWGIVVAVVIGVLIGVVVGLSLLGLLYLCRRCCCREEPIPPVHVPLRAAKEVPPMEELISAAAALAKQQGRAPDSMHYRRQASLPRPGYYHPHPIAASIGYASHAMSTIGRAESLRSQSDEHIYERYNAISRNSSGEFAEIIEPLPDPSGPQPSTSAHPVDGSDTLSTQVSTTQNM